MDIDGKRLLCASIRDVSERRATELEMQLQHLAIESTLNGVVITDPTRPDNPITYVNPGFLALTGYERDDVIGRNCCFLQGEETSAESIAEIRAALSQRKPCRVAIRN